MRGRLPVACEFRSVLPATLPAIEEFLVEFRQRSEGLRDPSLCFAAELLVREALTNAVVHGSRESQTRKVSCCLRLKGPRLLIAVADTGGGFDWREARRKPGEFPDSSGRGVGILFRYANWVRYNNKGNAVAMVKRFMEKESE